MAENPRTTIVDATLTPCGAGPRHLLSPAGKLAVLKRLAEVRVDLVLMGAPGCDEREWDFVRRAGRLNLGDTTRLAVVCPVLRKDCRPEHDLALVAVVEAATPVVVVAATASAYVRAKSLEGSQDDYLARVRDTVLYFKRLGREVYLQAGHFFQGLKENEAFPHRLLEVADDAGADGVTLCDSNGGALPREVRGAVAAVRRSLDATVVLGVEMRNDRELGVANSLEAVAEGASQVVGTVGGSGERCGYANWLAVAANLALGNERDVLRAGSLKQLTGLWRFVADQANLGYADGQPFVGPGAFAHAGGPYSVALLHDPARYEYAPAELFGNVRRVLFGDVGRRDNLREALAAFGLMCDDAQIDRVHREVLRLEKEGWWFDNANATLHLLALQVLGRRKTWFEVQHYKVNDRGAPAEPGTPDEVEASVKVKVDGKLVHSISDGEGPVNALDLALRKALLPCYPNLRGVKLRGYSVQVIDACNGEAAGEAEGTGRPVLVVIQSDDGDGNSWGTVGVSTNILSASWSALVDAFEYKLLLDVVKMYGKLPLSAAVGG